MKKRFFIVSDILVCISGIIGAGFATGQEISLYFKNKNPLLTTIFCFVFFCAFFLMGLNLKEVLREKEEAKRGIKTRRLSFFVLSDVFLVISCFFVLTAMLSGAQTNVDIVLGLNTKIPFFAILTALLCVFLSYFDLKGLTVVGIVLTPIMLFFILYVCFFKDTFTYKGEALGCISNSLFYVSLNSVTVTPLIAEFGKKYSSKQKLIFSFITSAVLSILIFFILALINSVNDDTMPLVHAAASNAVLGKIYGAIVLFSIITTILTCAYPVIIAVDKKVNNKIVSIFIVFFAAFCLSLLGFKRIIDYAYPLISLLGILLVIYFSAVFLHKKLTVPPYQRLFKQSDKQIHNGSNNAKH